MFQGWTVVLGFLVVSAVTRIESASASVLHGNVVFHVMNYNIHGMVFQPRKVDHSRYKKIGKILKARMQAGTAPDVVLIQEAFQRRTDELMEEAGYPYMVRGPKGTLGRIGSGLVIMSKYPIEFKDKKIYRECAGVDCLSRKGLHIARIRHPQIPFTIDLLNTHMQADYEDRRLAGYERAEKVRIQQAYDSGLFYNQKSIAPIGFFAGDFNSKRGMQSYNIVMSMTEMHSTLADCAQLTTCSPGENPEAWFQNFIDHQFYTYDPNAGIVVAPLSIRRTFTGEQGDHPELSDHAAIEAKYRISW